MTRQRKQRRNRPASLQRIGLALCISLFASVGGARAIAAAPVRVFRLPAEPLDQALVRFAVQGAVSIGGYPAPGCGGRSHPVQGLMAPREALRRLLPPGCAFEAPAPATFRILAAAPSAAPVAPPPRAPAPSAPADLPELIVTAERRAEPLLGSPFGVSAISGEEVRRLGAHTLSDVALQLVSVAETNLGPGRNKIFVRGLSDGAFTGRTQSTVGLYLDDVPITYNAPDPDLRLVDIERVEVLRGPQGSLYGSGSIGGIVRLVTAAPDPTAFAGEASIEGMVNGRNDQSFGVVGMLNVPLGDKAAVRAVAYRDQLAGYLDNPRLGLEDVNRGDRAGVRLSGLVNLGDAWRVQASFGHQSINTVDSQYTQGDIPPFQRQTQLAEPHDNDFTHLGLAVMHSGDKADLRVSAAYIDHDIQTRYDATGSFGMASSRPMAFDESQSAALSVVEAVLTSSQAGRLRWIVGLFGSVANERDHALLDFPDGGAGRSVFARRDRLREAAAFGELTYELTPELSATAGGRLFATRVNARADQFDLALAGVAPVQAHLTDEGFAPKIRLSYAFAPDVVVYAQMQEGYRAGGFNLPSGVDGVAGEPQIAAYRPDRLLSYELGGEAPLFDHRLILRAAVFRAAWSDVQTDQFRSSGLPVTLNIGDGANTGIEVEAVWRPDAHLQLRLNVLVDGPELTRTHDIFPARVDVGLPGVANETLSADIAYHWSPRAGWQAELSAQAAYVGRSFLTFDGSAASEMGGYGSGRVSASLTRGDWRLQAYLDNITDERGNTFAFGNPFSRTRTNQAIPLRPRTAGFDLSRRF